MEAIEGTGEELKNHRAPDFDTHISSADEVDQDNGKEWTVEDEPGVEITFISLPKGANKPKSVSFSRKRFKELEAQKWWGENRKRIYEVYSVPQSKAFQRSEDKPLKTPQDGIQEQALAAATCASFHGGSETEEWILMFTSLAVEGLSSLFEQLNYALLGMAMAIAGFLICIVEIVCKVRREKVTLEWIGRLPWLYSHYPSYKLFGSSIEYFGLVAAIWQCFHSSLGYFYASKHLQNPIKMTITMFLFCLCLLVSKIINKYCPRNLRREKTSESVL